ncbi:unnamed protein product [Candida verbasci]|uniref:RING-type domain-containing protein n=1 Tax=Candida verbasci TaxID=1227364 RepID=A0A9W4TS93_9ASCO|nr:unnamed protein product [Candida verbasci]
MPNTTNSTFFNESSGLNSESFSTSNNVENDEYFVLIKAISGVIDAIWDQSETSNLNTTPWNRLGAISKYCCSIYGLSCLIMALVLNRTLVMASTNNVHNQQIMVNRIRQRNRAENNLSVIIFILAILVNGIKLEGLNYASFFLHEDQTVGEGDDGITFDNRETNSIFRNLNINLNDDFYTALLNLGILAITSAGKSSYITELSLVILDSETWVERNIWENVQTILNKQKLNSVNNLQMVGYGNIFEKPSQKLISKFINSSDESSDDFGFSSTNNEYEYDVTNLRSSVIKIRVLYIKEMLTRFIQLLYGLLIKLVAAIISLFKFPKLKINHQDETRDETEEEFNIRKSKVPSFLKEYVKKKDPKKINRIETQDKSGNRSNLIETDDVTYEELESNYANLLLGPKEISGIDNSVDYQVIEYASESDYEESDIEEVNYKNQRSLHKIDQSIPMAELFSAENFTDLIINSKDYNMDILQSHFKRSLSGPLTRAKYNISRNVNNSSAILKQLDEDESLRLLDLIVAKRSEETDRDSTNDRSLECVICQINPREIITWPCKCFAICESCRLSLVSKNMEGCVCCRRQVKGVSKIFIP